jgi:glycerol-3-phosphate dehydrogenase
MTGERYDVAVIGAGINGAGIARDAALRGLKVAVIEQDDVCSGTSAISSRLIHGGLRYLEYGEIPLVFESLRERITLRKLAPHLIRPLRISIPIYKGAKRGPLLIRLGMLAYDVLSVGKTVPRHDMLDREQMLKSEPGLAGDGLLGAARYFDAQITFVERLVLENLLAAKVAGADILTHTAVTSIDFDADGVASIDCTDVIADKQIDIQARTVINAAGPWVDAVIDTAASEVPRLIGGTKGSHIVVKKFAGAPADAFYVEALQDGRPFFVIPWNDQYLIGTTDIRFDGDMSEIRASRKEVDYLLTETNRVFPAAQLSEADIQYAYAGVRPLPKQDKGPESAITRRHIILTNTRIARSFISIIGGKLTTYRNLAEQAVDRLGKVLGQKLPACRTKDNLLPGAYRIAEARDALTSIDGLSSAGVERLLGIYGGRAVALIAHARASGQELNCIDSESSVLAAEVSFAVREEMPRSLIDIVYRRMMIGLDADQGRALYNEVATLAAAAFGWSADESASQLDMLNSYSDSFRIWQ